MSDTRLIRLNVETRDGADPGIGPVANRLANKPGEAVMVLVSSSGHVWLHRKDFFPPGVMRLPTGTLKPGEDPGRGFLRELHEETGIVRTKPAKCLGRLRYSLDGVEHPFVSHVYMIEGVDDQPVPVDESEGISAWEQAPAGQFVQRTRHIESLPGDWQTWGVFRAAAHRLVIEKLFADHAQTTRND